MIDLAVRTGVTPADLWGGTLHPLRIKVRRRFHLVLLVTLQEGRMTFEGFLLFLPRAVVSGLTTLSRVY